MCGRSFVPGSPLSFNFLRAKFKGRARERDSHCNIWKYYHVICTVKHLPCNKLTTYMTEKQREFITEDNKFCLASTWANSMLDLKIQGWVLQDISNLLVPIPVLDFHLVILNRTRGTLLHVILCQVICQAVLKRTLLALGGLLPLSPDTRRAKTQRTHTAKLESFIPHHSYHDPSTTYQYHESSPKSRTL